MTKIEPFSVATTPCKSGKRLKPENRVFFQSENEALENGFRPCGHCMKNEYRKWVSLVMK